MLPAVIIPLIATDDPTFEPRVAFVAELAARLHAYGTTAQRLEGAVAAVAQRLGLACEVWSNPTGIILSFADPERGRLGGVTRVIRLAPGEQNLGRLAATDAIAEDVLAGTVDPVAGRTALLALDRPPTRRARLMTTFSFGLSSGAVAGLLGAGVRDVFVAAAIGLVIGGLSELSSGRPRLTEALEAIAAMLATLLAAAAATWLGPLSVETVILASLIVLMPGLMLTNAVTELSSQQLVSGTARFAGALMILMKLTFGTVAAMQVVRVFGWELQEAVPVPPSTQVEVLALLVAGYAFAVQFRAARRDFAVVIAAVLFGYLLTRVGNALLGTPGFAGGVFIAGMGVAAASNLFGKFANRPGALVRVPGIILLVPGSIGFRSLGFVMERDVFLGLDTGFALLSALIALVAGLLFGNLLVPIRRNI
jgi:uncharacterized membrane protein YjjP (DUF1212 family)